MANSNLGYSLSIIFFVDSIIFLFNDFQALFVSGFWLRFCVKYAIWIITLFLWDGNLWVVVIVKRCVNKQAGLWLAAKEWTTNQKPDYHVDPTIDNEYNS